MKKRKLERYLQNLQIGFIYITQDEDFWKKNPYGWRRWQAVLDFMDAEDHTDLLPALKEYLTHLDSVRKTDFKKTFPFLKCLMK